MLSVFNVWNDFQDQKVTLIGSALDSYQSLDCMSNILSTCRKLKTFYCFYSNEDLHFFPMQYYKYESMYI